MNILITNIWLANHGGTEVHVRDLACSLHNQGIHVEVYSPLLGAVANEIRSAGIHTVNSTDKLLEKPDLIHGQHFIPTMEVMARFSDVPIIYFLHDRTHIIDTPPKYSKIIKYVAVDYNCLDRLIIDNRINRELTDVLYNWVDTSRFKLRQDFSDKPARAMVFSNHARNDNYFLKIQEACIKKGIELDVAGIGFGNQVKDPERILPKYDIVFAKAKAAMEALATGAAVILCDYRGLGEMVTIKNFDHLRKYNFGMKTLNRSHDANLIIQEIEKYNPEENKKTALKIKKEASFDLYIDKLLNLYTETLEKYKQSSFQNNNSEDKRIIKQYLTLKRVLFYDKINKYKEDSKLHTTNLVNQINDIKSSWSYKLGRFLTFPLRFIYELIKSSRKSSSQT